MVRSSSGDGCRANVFKIAFLNRILLYKKIA